MLSVMFLEEESHVLGKSASHLTSYAVPSYRCIKIQVTPLKERRLERRCPGTSSWKAGAMNGDIAIETHEVIAEVYGIIDCDTNELNATVEIHFTADATTVIDEAFRVVLAVGCARRRGQ